MRDVYPDIQALGAELVAVGNGQPHMARGFRAERNIPFPLLVDPERELYQALEFHRSVGRILSLGAVTGAFRAMRQGHSQGKTQGDALQLGGAVLITPQGQIAYEYKSRNPGDHPQPQALLAAVKAAVQPSS